MKKFILAATLACSTLPAFAQAYGSCQVAAIDRYNRIVARFYGQTDYRGVCQNALRQCNYEIRMRGWYDLRCVQYRSRW